jgi:hypothetical protein
MKMKRYLLALILVLAMAMPAMAWNLGYTYNYSDFDMNTSNVKTDTDSFMAGGVLGSGQALGSSYAGGQAFTAHLPAYTIPGANGGATQNFGEALGGFSYDIKTGNKNFLWVIPPVAGAIGGTKGDVSQWSKDHSFMFVLGTPSGFGMAGSCAFQESGAGFIGADADLLIGKNKGAIGSFTGDSVVWGNTYSYSYKGMIGDPLGLNTKYIGTLSGAENGADTLITGGIGTGYAFGRGQTSGFSTIQNPLGSTAGFYSGQFSYCGNGSGNVSGYSESYRTLLPAGQIVGTSSGVRVNVNLK